MTWSRAPAVPVAAVLMAGIAVDHWFPIDLRWWLGFALVGLVWGLGFSLRDQLRLASTCLLLAFVAIGAARHHWAWNIADRDDIGCFATESPRLVRIVARLDSTPQTTAARADAWDGGPRSKPRTMCTLECRQIAVSGTEYTPLSGRARLHVNGLLPDVETGDELEFTAHLESPGGPRFDGDFDFATYLRSSGIRAILTCTEPDGIVVRQQGAHSLSLFQQRLRTHCENVLRQSLSSDTAPVGIAILLGTRTGLTNEIRRDFAESGTTHILAISGVNVAILATLLWGLCRILLHMGHSTTIWLVLGGVGIYWFIADNNPPVLRAVIMSVVFFIGMFRFRATSPINSLGAAAFLVLLCNPTHLFDVGAQLSFLAVLGLVSSNLWLQSLEPPVADPNEALEELARTWWQRCLLLMRKKLVAILVSTTAVWLFTLPLMLARFQILSPVGFAVNVLLSPFSFGMLWAGYLAMILGSIWQPLGIPFAFAFDWALWGLIKVVGWSAHASWGHVYVPGPPEWWLAGFYILLTIGVIGYAARAAHWQSLAWKTLAIWTVLGLALPLLPRRDRGLTCQFLPVGHGVAVLLELPNGKNVLYDAGQMQNSAHAEQAVQQTLWRTQRPRIDALLLSHADADHFNAVPGLVRSVPIDNVLMHRTFLDFDQPLVKRACDELESRRVPVRLLEEGDRLRLDEQVELIVRQPPWNGFRGSDNANSLVLEVFYAGRRILLTGDLEGAGLQNLLHEPPPDGGVDVLLSPHHGSRQANTAGLASWAKPRCVVVSGGRRDGGERLREVYGKKANLLSTHSCGTVKCRIDPAGSLQITTFRTPSKVVSGDH